MGGKQKGTSGSSARLRSSPGGAARTECQSSSTGVGTKRNCIRGPALVLFVIVAAAAAVAALLLRPAKVTTSQATHPAKHVWGADFDLDAAFRRAEVDRVRNFSVTFTAAFTPEECDEIIRMMGDITEDALVGDQTPRAHDKATRIAKTREVDVNEEPGFLWVHHRVLQLATEANRIVWRMGSLQDVEHLNLIMYRAQVNGSHGHYDWHIDNEGGPEVLEGRLLSCSLQLTSPEDYEGGDLAVGSRSSPKGRGDLVVFPSYLPHRVMPVTKGERRAVVIWIRGPTGRRFTNAGFRAQKRALSDKEGWASLQASGILDPEVAATAPPNFHWTFGTTLLRMGEYKKAVEQMRAALNMDPQNEFLLNNLAVAEYKSGDISAAIATLERAVKHQPNDVEAQTNLGRLLEGVGDDVGAAKAFTAVAKSTPDDKEVAAKAKAARKRAQRAKQAAT